MNNSETFVTTGEVLSSFAQQCNDCCAYLKANQQVSHTVLPELLEWVAKRQANIAQGLERCAEEAPDGVVKRRLQFEPGHAEWSSPSSTEAAMRQTIDLNNAIVEALSAAAETAPPVEFTELVGDLTRQLEGTNRRIALGIVTSQDLQ
ncbi:hypothetical protein NOR51B_775 [Luminiphilus syltensis NOR5-1B]|uniref:DUF2383 domain-containing protein n=1 Tax=Luminiphilus syltensis NOR5-1B TaxID=565045 RepID=B8KTV9_9GAMM|nr:hypothetical protein [Luminiphilus syltensis]EED34836.1 hypothetical protein NOR51B_775 [Luminiphilus syltensis NOR5-1B]